MSIAVTGATGFIGRHVIAQLRNRGVDPIAVCRGSAEIQGVTRIARIDLSAASSDVFEAMGRPSTLIHLAWGGLPNYRSLHHFETELPQHYRFLKLAIEGGVQNVLVAGTCLEYGLQSGSLHEGLLPQPVTAYGYAKDALRRQLQYLQLQRPFNLTWARLFYTYGEGQAKGSLLSQLRQAVDSGAKTFDMSQGEQLRDYLPVEDVAGFLVELALSARDNGIVNVCSGRPVSVRRLVEGWIAQHGWSIELNLGRYPYLDYEPLAFWGLDTKLLTCTSRPA
jgi:nucleoside-diphosphate-sugar epimerase